jgi:hypothetical protein
MILATDPRRLTRTICLRKITVCVFLCGSRANLIVYGHGQAQRKKGLRRILVRLQGTPKDKPAVADLFISEALRAYTFRLPVFQRATAL